MPYLSTDSRRQTLPSILAAVAALSLLIYPDAANAENGARLQTQLLNVSDLHQLESAQPEVLYAQSYQIPYDSLEPLIEQALAVLIDQTIKSELGGYSGTIDCGYPCDWVSWQILDPGSSFQFTEKSQPSVTASRGGHKIQVRLKMAARIGYQGKVRGRINTDFTTPATPGGTDEADFPFDIKIDAEVEGLMRLTFYPILKLDEFSLAFAEITKVSVNGIDEFLIAKGLELGTKIGFSPGGVVFGGPLAWGLTGAIFGNEGGDLLEEWIAKIGETYISTGIQQGFAEISQQIEQVLGVANLEARNLQQEILNSQVPGTGQTIAQLTDTFGLSLQIRAQTPASDLNVTVTARVDPKLANQGFPGILLIPKKECSQKYHKILGWGPGLWKEVNQDLADELGKPCQQLLAAKERVSFRSRAFLGQRPPGTSLAFWKTFGKAQLVGDLSDFGDYYRCGITVGNLPAAGIIEVEGLSALSAWVPEILLKSRYLFVGPVLINHTLSPVDQIVLGGEKGCSSGGGSGLQLGGPASVIEELENCPQCGLLESRPGAAQSNPARQTGIQPRVVATATIQNTSITAGLVEKGFQPQPDPPRARIVTARTLVAGQTASLVIALDIPSIESTVASSESLWVVVEVLAGESWLHRSTQQISATPGEQISLEVRFAVPRGLSQVQTSILVDNGYRSVVTRETQEVVARRGRR